MFKVDISTVKVYLNTSLAKLVLFHLDTVNMERFSGLTFCSFCCFEEWFSMKICEFYIMVLHKYCIAKVFP